jgi:Ca2+-binding EF-hand superfamily protein
MQMQYARRVSTFAVAGFLAASAHLPGRLSAQPAPAPPVAARTALSPGMQLLIARLRTDLNATQYSDQLRNEFYQLDANADGALDKADIDLHEAIEAIQLRQSSAQQMMRFDLDGDGVVTEDEIRAVMRYNSRTQLGAAAANSNSSQGFAEAYRQAEAIVQSFRSLDADNDGKVTFAEAGNAAKQIPRQNRENTASGRTQQALTLAATPGGSLPLNDFLGAGEAVFRKLDADGDGKISQQETVEFWRSPAAPDAAAQAKATEALAARSRQRTETQQQQQQRSRSEPAAAMRVGCAMPAPTAKAKLMLLGLYQAEALSSLAIDSQDVVVHAGRLVIEPGEQPLYIVIPTHAAVIWQVSGAVERVERLVLTSGTTGPNSGAGNVPPLVGAAGLPSERVSFFAHSGCLRFFSEVPSAASVEATAAVRQAAGREPDAVISANSVLGFNLPSGKINSMQQVRVRTLTIEKSEGSLRIEGNPSNVIVRAGPSSAREDLLRYSPGGIFEIDPKSVVSSRPVQPYEVYPYQAGLVQLLETGALTQNQSGEYIVRKKFRFPAGLYGAHSVKFVVLRGTPIPEGDPGHSCVIAEEGTPPGVRNCR